MVQNIINEDTISAYGVKILFIDKKLLKIDDEYWSNDICPNLNWTFASPNVIFSSFRIDMNGRLYQGKSSWCFENINKVKVINWMKIILNIMFLLIFLKKNKNNKIPIIEIVLLIVELILVIKFNNNAITPINRTPIIMYSDINSLFL